MRHREPRTCVACGRTFAAATRRSVRCYDCGEDYHRAACARRIAQRRIAEALESIKGMERKV